MRIPVFALLLVACGTSTPTTQPDAGPLPTCPTTCEAFCTAGGVCSCDGQQCEREPHGSLHDAGADAP